MPDVKHLTEERRQYPRYPVVTETYVVFNDSETRLGRVIDISAGGIAFRFVGSGQPRKLGVDLDIFVANRELAVYRLPYRIRSLVALADASGQTPAPARRCGVELGLMSSSQIRGFTRLMNCAAGKGI
jgi:hypothetical protein